MDKTDTERWASSSPRAPQKHAPQMLYIGCVDARLDPIDDLGIEKGKALIKRDIAALVTPQNASTGATLDFFLNHVPAKPGEKKHIIVSGHTDCGGLKACRDHSFSNKDTYLPGYLDALKDVRQTVMEKAEEGDWSPPKILGELQKESVRQSVDNLRTYPAVQQALDDGNLEIHGWLLNTRTQEKMVLDPQTSSFKPMNAEYAQALGLATRTLANAR